MGGSGLSAMINAGAALEHEFENLIVVSIGCPAEGAEGEYEMQIYGAQLAFRINLRAAGLTLGAALMDSAEAGWDLLLRTTDDGPGWNTARRLAASLERNGVKSLQRPIQVGEVGDPDAWVIA
jgi:hypothetical protein